MADTERREHTKTQAALNTAAIWGRDPIAAGGENIAFSLSRQGSPGDDFTASGDCTPFTSSGHRGILRGQPAGLTGAPFAHIKDESTSPTTLAEVPITFSFDLNAGKVTVAGVLAGHHTPVHFTVEFRQEFVDEGGRNLLFVSDHASDHAGYAIALQLVAAS